MGEATGGGKIGPYTFSQSGAAAIYQYTPDGEGGAPSYYLTVFFSGQTPCFWLDGLHLDTLPAHFLSQPDELVYFYAHTLPERGVFRRFYQLTFPIDLPLQGTYTFDLGEGRELRYTVTLREVTPP